MKGLYDCEVIAQMERMNKANSSTHFPVVLVLVHDHAEGASNAQAAAIVHMMMW
jgi:hypothetical protein